ncbi:MAG: hypothetical protein ABR532_01520 [Candidatus Dormibacteria bacterium]
MTYYDPAEHIDADDRADWEVRQHLWAQRRLRDLEQKGYARTPLFDTPQNGDRCHRRGCRGTGRLIRLTGDVVCPGHDPLAVPHWGAACCTRGEE